MSQKSVIRRPQENQGSFQQGINYCLVIGIDNYVDCPKLYNAVKDCKDIIATLLDRFQFEKENITTLFNEEATKHKIYNAFRDFRRKITSSDNFIIYFSGHGELDKDFGEGYWIPVEAGKETSDQFIPNSYIKKILSAIPSHHTFLLVDSCFSGSLFAKGTGKDIHQRKERDPSRWGLTSGRNEIVTDGEPNTNSPFAQSILYQLKNADQPLGVAKLCDKVLEIVSTNADQTPRGEPLKMDGHRGGQFVFHLKMNHITSWNNALFKDLKTTNELRQATEQDLRQADKLRIGGYHKEAFQIYFQHRNSELFSTFHHYRLGELYEYGQGVKKDYKKALKWYRKAAKLGSKICQTKMGYMYHTGQGVKKDYKKAMKWYLKAAERGNAMSQSRLGYMYYAGLGVEKDEKEAIRWYRKAAKQGDYNAIKALKLLGFS